MEQDDREQKETLQVDVDLPHDEVARAAPLFERSKKMLMEHDVKLVFELDRPAGRCFICQKTEAEVGPLEAHHFALEHCFMDATLRWDLIKADFPSYDWKNFDPTHPEMFVDQMVSSGLLLCKLHHTGKDAGIHYLPFPLWLVQRYLADGIRFSPTEIIHHDDV
jgi:hypothetical protein